MIIDLPTDNFNIRFKLMETTKFTRDINVHKFSLSFHHIDKNITFSLPKNYQSYLNDTDIIRLVKMLGQAKSKLMSQNNEQEVFIHFENFIFVNTEYDLEIIFESGEYYIEEQEGAMNFIILFNINVAYKKSGSNMIGLSTRADLEDIDNFVRNLEKLVFS